MPSIKVRDGEPFDVALRRFRTSCDNAGVLTDVKKKEFFEKKTWVKKRKTAAAKQRSHKELLKNKVQKRRLY